MNIPNPPSSPAAAGTGLNAVSTAAGAASIATRAAPTTLSGLSSFLTAAQPYLMVAQIAFSFIAKNKAKARAKRDARESTAVKIKSVLPIEANEAINIAYGITATTGHRCFVATAARGTIDLNEIEGTMIGRPGLDRTGFDNFDRRTNTFKGVTNEFLLMQHVLSVGKIKGLIDFGVDGATVHVGGAHGGLGPELGWAGTHAAAWLVKYQYASGTARSMAPTQRSFNSTYHGRSYSNFIAQLPNEASKRKFNTIPEPVFIIAGREIPALANNMRTTEVDAHDNAGLVALDFLQNGLYGPSLPDNLIDFPSWQTFHDRANKALLDTSGNTGNISRDITVNNEGDTLNEYLRRLRIHLRRLGFIDFDDSLITHGDRGLRSGFTNIKWGAYNGLVSSSLDWSDALEQIIQGCPGAVIYWSFDGKIKISAPDWEKTAAQQSVATITDAHLPEGQTGLIQTLDPDINGRYNRYIVTFNDIENSFHENSVTWPHEKSDFDLLKAQDGGRVLEEEERAAGIVTATQALTLARHRVLESRRRLYTGAYSFAALDRIIEPGEVFRIDSKDSLVQEYVRMGDMEVNFVDGTVAFEAQEFQPLDYGPLLAARHTEIDSTPELETVGAFIRVTGVPDVNVPAGTAIRLQATVIGTTTTPTSWTWTGVGLSSTNTAITNWTPTASRNSVTVAAVMSPNCTLEATVTVNVAAQTTPRARVVAQGGRRYGVLASGFTGTPTHAWTITPPAAGTLSSTTASSVNITGGNAAIRGVIKVTSTSGTETASDTLLFPYRAFDDEQGGENTVDGAMEIL